MKLYEYQRSRSFFDLGLFCKVRYGKNADTYDFMENFEDFGLQLVYIVI